jgi:RNA polymerase sigma-70 factor, ECF subfamily
VSKHFSLNNTTDEVLFTQYRRGNKNAFHSIVQRHERALYNFVLRQVHVSSTAEDMVQETFVRVVQNADSFKEESRFSTWLYTIARNLCIDFLRKKAHKNHTSLDVSPDSQETNLALQERLATPELGADRNSINQQLQKHIQKAVETLPEEQREVFMLRHVTELAFKEIADIVGVNENTVKSRMRYALERLQLALAEFEDYAKIQSTR